jgi:hypothetical protein
MESFTPLTESEWETQTNTKPTAAKKNVVREGYEDYRKRVDGLVDFSALTEEDWVKETQPKEEEPKPQPRFTKSVAKPAEKPTENYEQYLFRTSGLPTDTFTPLSETDWLAETAGRKYVSENEEPKTPQFEFTEDFVLVGDPNGETNNQ